MKTPGVRGADFTGYREVRYFDMANARWVHAMVAPWEECPYRCTVAWMAGGRDFGHALFYREQTGAVNAMAFAAAKASKAAYDTARTYEAMLGSLVTTTVTLGCESAWSLIWRGLRKVFSRGR